MKTAWLRELASLARVAPVARTAEPRRSSCCTSEGRRTWLGLGLGLRLGLGLVLHLRRAAHHPLRKILHVQAAPVQGKAHTCE